MKTERKKTKKQVTYNVEKEEIDNLFQLFKAKRIKECEIACRKLLKKYPALLPAMNILGSCLNVLQKYDDAIQIFTKINTLEPTFTPAHYNRGIACHHKHLYEEAIKSFDRTIELEPNHIDAIYTKGAALSELNRYEEAITYLQLTVNSQKNNLHAMHALGYAYEKLQQYEKAKELYAQTINIDSNYAEAYSSQGRLNSIRGNKTQAVDFYKKALEVNPESANTHRSLSRLIKYTKNDPYISMMENIYNKGMKNDKKRMHLCYALSKAYEDIENYDKCFNQLKEANEIRKKELNYNVNNDIKLVQHIMEVYSKSKLNINEEIDKKDDIKPIFILGMPRSGTSLVEQILSSHKEVYGAGELDEVREFINDIIFSKNI